ncbi:hypothetical protein MARA_41810 [Mycolicibacterium arabiense]|uniref:Uncharacterized protein n=1 Tax=Mycolicibacterium arabiense TaxID=1286181 RepID=A0A7I7S1Z2_9MYCO|nr:hypothetical protein MARA_41810 [Mycolicibacterium arabiense]
MATTHAGTRSKLNRTGEPTAMSYVDPRQFVTKMIDAGEAKVFMSTRDTVIRAYMAGASSRSRPHSQ